MNPDITALERAFELAKSGRFANSTEIKSALAAEGYSTSQITGRVLLRQLRKLIAEHRKATGP